MPPATRIQGERREPPFTVSDLREPRSPLKDRQENVLNHILNIAPPTQKPPCQTPDTVKLTCDERLKGGLHRGFCARRR
ncbi:MAG: hypothetical protein AMXMBFR47_40230 [Planctomycetota bacterium]